MTSNILVSAVGGLVFAVGALYPSLDAQARCDKNETIVKFSHETDTDQDPKGVAATILAERIDAQMNGILCMQVYPKSSLTTDDKVIEALAKDEVQLAVPSLSHLSSVNQNFLLFQLPFLFKDLSVFDHFIASAPAQELSRSLVPLGVQGLLFWRAGMQQMSADRPLLVPTDAARVKFATDGVAAHEAMFHELGAFTQAIPAGQLVDALQDKRVDGLEGDWPSLYRAGVQRLQDGATQTNHRVNAALVLVSGKFWGSLKPQVREQFWRILWQLTQERNQVADTDAARARDAITDAGGLVRELTQVQRRQWLAAVQPIWKKYEGKIDPEVMSAALDANP